MTPEQQSAIRRILERKRSCEDSGAALPESDAVIVANLAQEQDRMLEEGTEAMLALATRLSQEAMRADAWKATASELQANVSPRIPDLTQQCKGCGGFTVHTEI